MGLSTRGQLRSFRAALLLCLPFLIAPLADAQLTTPGNVGRALKINNVSGGLPAVLQDGDKFGVSVTAIGDVDGDGITDLGVGAYQDDDLAGNAGAIYVLFMNADGTVDVVQKLSGLSAGLTAKLEAFDQFGVSMTALGDLDGDGVPDLAVGAEGDDDGGNNAGAAYILFLNADGTLKARQKLSPLEGGFSDPLGFDHRFGRGMACLGDVDGDGVTDLAVGAPRDDDGGVKTGAVHVLFLNTNGTVKMQQKISALEGGFSADLDPVDGFGFAVCGLGDRDGDGVPDLIASAQTDDDGGTDRGALYVIYLTATGMVKAHHKISALSGGFGGSLSDGDRLGSSLALIGDLDGNGSDDLVAGARRDDNLVGTDRGAVWVLLTDADEQVIGQRRINGVEGDLPVPLDDQDQFGGSVGAIGDIDGDGLADVAVGCTGDDDGGVDQGSVHVLRLADGSWSNLYDGLAGSRGEPELTGFGGLAPLSTYSFRLTQGRPNGTAWIVLGTSAIHAPFKGGTMVPAPDIALGPLVLDAEGALTLAGQWPLLPSGFQSFYQCWLPDLAGPQGFSGSNGVVIVQP